MNLVADEGVDRRIVEQLRQDGHDVVYVAELTPSIADDEVLQQANDRHAPLVISDKDFGELVFRLNRVAAGVILTRLEGLLPETKAIIVAQAIRDHEAELLHSFSVITPGMIRIRPRL
jgi:predicted nuclease of predicted toxin-antitoxin system